MEQVQQEMKEQMKEMMKMIKNLTKGKNSVENPVMANVATPQERNKEKLVFQMIYTHPKAKTSQGAYSTMIPQLGGFPVIYHFALMVQMTNVG